MQNSLTAKQLSARVATSFVYRYGYFVKANKTKIEKQAQVEVLTSDLLRMPPESLKFVELAVINWIEGGNVRPPNIVEFIGIVALLRNKHKRDNTPKIECQQYFDSNFESKNESEREVSIMLWHVGSGQMALSPSADKWRLAQSKEKQALMAEKRTISDIFKRSKT